jgi:teichuronic acid exporter
MKLSEKSYFLFSSLLSQGVRIVSALALFRLLTPIDYGAVALVAIVPGYIAAFGDLGAMRAVYVLDGREPKARGTCLTIALLASTVLAVVSLGAGLYLGWVRGEPVFYLLGLLAALNAPLSSVYEYGLVLLNLERNFVFEANTRLLRGLVTSCGAVLMALVGFGPVAISGSILVGTALAFAIVFVWHRRVLSLGMNPQTARKALGLGIRMTGAQYLSNLNPTFNATLAVLAGGQLGLGLFGRATQLLEMFNYSILVNLMRIFQPDFRHFEKGSRELSSSYCRGCLICWYLSIPAALIIFLRAPEIIFIFMGPEWSQVADLIWPMAIAMGISSASGMSHAALQCVGRAIDHAVASLLCLVTVGLIYWFAGHGSLLVLSIAVASGQVVFAIYLFVSARVQLHLDINELLKHVPSLVLSSGVVLLLAHFVASPQNLKLSCALQSVLATATLVGVCIYGSLAAFHWRFVRSLLYRAFRF